MKKFYSIIALLLLLSASSSATIRRVGFFAAFVINVDYSSFGAAYTASAAGDTILVFPGIAPINQTLTKKLIIIGTGDWLNPSTTPKGNANQQAFAGVVTVAQIIFGPGSDGSTIMGLEGGTYYIGASNITIRRNRELVVYLAGANPAVATNNIQLLENYRLTVGAYYTNGSTVTGINVSNNFIASFTTGTGNTYNGNISNNVWAYDETQNAGALNGGASVLSSANAVELGGGAYLLQNNIFCSYTIGSSYNYFGFSNGGNTIFNYNLALQTTAGAAQTWGPGTGNVITPVANAAAIFAAWPAIGSNTADARYQLAAGSPALTTGAGGTPIGMFAGTTPYKLSMVPSIPSIYQLSSPQGNNPPGSTIQISVSTRGNN
ncbi:MAG: hypothetical protein ABJA78_06100 [Ferruginibacter sp.]